MLALPIGLLTIFGLCLVGSLVFFAMDDEPQEQNLRALRERAEGLAAANAECPVPVCDDLKVAA